MKVNKKLLNETLQEILTMPIVPKRARKDREVFNRLKGLFWDQRNWGKVTENHCGTSCCFAGLVAHNHYKTLVFGEYEYAYIGVKQRKPIHIRNFAERKLGLTRYQSSNLFHHKNTKQDLKRIVAGLCEDPPRIVARKGA